MQIPVRSVFIFLQKARNLLNAKERSGSFPRTLVIEPQPGIRMAEAIQNVKHSIIVGLYVSKLYTLVTNAAVQPAINVGPPFWRPESSTVYIPTEKNPKTQL